MSIDYRQYPEYNRFFEEKGWLVEKVNGSLVLIRRFPVVGSVIKIKRCSPEISFKKLNELAKEHHAFFIRLELNLTTDDPRAPKLLENLKKFGYEESSWAVCPTRSLCIDLTLSLGELLAQTNKDVRRYLRKNEEKNFEFRTDQNLEVFYPLLLEAGRIKGYLIPKLSDLKAQWGTYGEDIKLLLGYQNDELLGGSLTMCRDEKAFGIYMALSEKGTAEHFSYSLMWESIKIAKQANCKTLDLDGIYDPRYRAHGAWKGLSTFKKKFGGREIEFVGGFIKSRFLLFRILPKLGLL